MLIVDAGTDEQAGSYAAAAQLLEALPATVMAERGRRKLTVAAAAKAIGITSSTMTGLEGGSNCTRSTAAAVLRWLAA